MKTELLTEHERQQLEKRIQILELLNQGKTFNEIRDQLKVGSNTISLVKRLKESI